MFPTLGQTIYDIYVRDLPSRNWHIMLQEKLDDLATADKLATVLTDKEKELKVTQQDLEAQKDVAVRLTKELKDKDEERLTRDRESLDLEASDSIHVVAYTM